MSTTNPSIPTMKLDKQQRFRASAMEMAVIDDPLTAAFAIVGLQTERDALAASHRELLAAAKDELAGRCPRTTESLSKAIERAERVIQP